MSPLVGRLRHYLPPLIVLVLFIGGWQAVTVGFAIPGYLLPSPVAILAAAYAHRTALGQATWVTFESSALGFVLSVVLGVGVALMMSVSKWLEQSLYPYAILLQTIPIVAIAPLIVIWVGAGMGSIIIIAFLVAVFPVISNTNFGLISTDRHLLNLMALYGASRWRTMVKLRLPAALPHMLSAMKISAGLSVIGAIVGQFIAGIGGGQGGLGYLIIATAQQLQMPYLFAAALASAVLGIVSFLLVSWLAQALIGRWHESLSPMT
ncbi:Binding-protein-dependent transport systems inner membrane component [Sulfobacillus acidophilus TPY]|uniref:ABC-type transporter, integral membrane subunit n=1 Tax=Sulfobacillus acidophilus (strain ATCC 700253 / DSM 10332 / NAL) TaxID=679936 RepID=G8TUR6_SULAD|nr:Binding-protein-dependent transport systems inner membrane component [Sulfobacillus acidophilus TPY]AEW05790.1 ABC-type transporter, integral membrane subunit [Sulfobacillus acidophilus DSM 10332]